MPIRCTSLFYTFCFALVVGLLCSNGAHAQMTNVDSTKVDTVKAVDAVKNKDHKPRTATLMSMCLPGLGQVYNHKIWKVPIIYILGAALGLWVYDNATLHNKFSTQYKYMINNKLALSPEFVVSDVYDREYNLTGVTPDNIKFYRDNSERQRNLNVIGIAGLYLLNMIDANVDAHLRDFKITDNLSLHWKPEYKFMPQTGNYLGIAVQLHLQNKGTKFIKNIKN